MGIADGCLNQFEDHSGKLFLSDNEHTSPTWQVSIDKAIVERGTCNIEHRKLDHIAHHIILKSKLIAGIDHGHS